MLRKQFIFIAALLVGLGIGYYQYTTYKPSVVYTLPQLEQNPYNQQLKLQSNPKADFKKLCKQFADLDKTGIEKFLSKTNPELTEVSFALHYLANRYLSDNNFERGFHYLRLSAEQYLNAFSYLKLAQIYATPQADIQAKFPNQTISIQQDWVASAKYLQTAMRIAETILNKQQDNYVLNFVSQYGEILAEKITQQDSIVQPQMADIQAFAKEKEKLYEKIYLTVHQ